MKNPLKTLEPNLLGRDFVVGDIHGCLSAFKNLIKNINFNHEVDRMISVGDLVDRGDDSFGCLSLIREPWFHSVLANHECMMLDMFFGDGSNGGDMWFSNGGDWAMEAYNDYIATYVHQNGRIPTDNSMQIIDLLPLVNQLPYLITVNTKSGKKFHVIHAEFMPGQLITDELLTDPVQVLKFASMVHEEGPCVLWARHMFDAFNYENLQGTEWIKRVVKRTPNPYNDKLSHIISGHTIIQRPMTVLGQTNIDTGARDSYWGPIIPYGRNRTKPKAWAALTCVELDTWKFYQATETTFKEVEPLVISEEDIS